MYTKLIKNVIEEIASKNLLDAFFDILAGYCKKWIDGEKLTFTKGFENAEQFIVGANDKFQDFIDKKLIITNDETDRISKDAMRDAFLEMYPDKHLNTQQIIGSLKGKKLTYDGGKRVDNVRGIFEGVKFRTEEDTDHEDDGTNLGIDVSEKSIKLANMSILQQIEYYQKQVHIAQQQLTTLAEKFLASSKQSDCETKKTTFGHIERPKYPTKKSTKKPFKRTDSVPKVSDKVQTDIDDELGNISFSNFFY